MSHSSNDFMEQREFEQQEEDHRPEWNEVNEATWVDPTEMPIHEAKLAGPTNQPLPLVILPGRILTLSKESAEAFHDKMKSVIYETGYGLFEYLETIKFFTKIEEVIRGKDGNEGDKDFVSYIRDEIKKQGEKEKLLTARGVKFENVETGTKYDFSGDPVWCRLDADARTAIDRRKEREELLKTLKPQTIHRELIGDEVVDAVPPIKTSKSSFKITLAK